MSRKLFLFSQLQHIINIDTRKLFYNAHIKPHIEYASVVWGGCGEVHLKNKKQTQKLNSYIEGQTNKSFLILPYLQSKR